jgi:SPRY domain
MTIDGSIINYGLLLALAVSHKLESSDSHNSEVEAANQLAVLKCSSGNTAMSIDEQRFLYTRSRTGTVSRFRFIKNNNPEDFSERFADTYKNNDMSQYCTTVQYISNIGVGFRSIRTKQPFYPPELIMNMPMNSVITPDQKKLGIFGRLKSSIKRFLGRKYSDVKNSAIVKGTFHTEDNTKKVSYFWKPFVIPFVSTYCEATLTREVQLMPRLVCYFEITILSPDAAIVNRHTSERPMGSVREVTESVAIGIAECTFPLSGCMPGWDMQSYGYHGDNGHAYHGSGGQRRRRRQLDGEDLAFGPKYGVNDTVGCGIDYHKRSIFFTFNGTFLGYAFQDLAIDMLSTTVFFPVVGIDTNCPIYCNFGYKDPFSFDLTSYILLHQKEVLLQTLVGNSTKDTTKRKSKARKSRR